jgi:hypothetical protein
VNIVGPYYRQDSSYYETADERVAGFEAIVAEERGEPFRLPTRKIVCPQCNGRGRIVNRSIDGNGLDPNDPDLDADFWDDYRSGVYDVVCDECRGANVVDEVDRDRLTVDVLAAWDEYVADVEDAVAQQLAELRAGA